MIKVSKWYEKEVCAHCEEELSREEKYNNLGVCCKCGYESHQTVICATHTIKYRKIRNDENRPKWKIWNLEYIYEGADQQSTMWLKNQGML